MKIIELTTNLIDESYSLFDASELNIGDTVSHDIYIKRSEKYIIIIEAGTILTPKLYNLLQMQESLYAFKKSAKDIHTPVADVKSTNCKTLLARIKRDKKDLSKTLQMLYDTSEQIFTNFINHQNNKIDVQCIEIIVESIILLIKNNQNFMKESMPKITNDHKLYAHSLNVAIYALHIGYLLHYDDEQLFKLGIAALLHDIGKKSIPDIINKNGSLNDEELKSVRECIELSSSILYANDINDILIHNAINHHQERYDGSGYPNNLIKDDISNFGSILAICDVFDALTTDRPYRKAYATFEALKLMIHDTSMKNKFNNGFLKKGLISIT